jgi:hypothetical protein
MAHKFLDRADVIAVLQQVGTISNGIEAELLEWHRRKLCKRFCAHH